LPTQLAGERTRLRPVERHSHDETGAVHRLERYDAPGLAVELDGDAPWTASTERSDDRDDRDVHHMPRQPCPR
jgi:hypothetical protein